MTKLYILLILTFCLGCISPNSAQKNDCVSDGTTTFVKVNLVDSTIYEINSVPSGAFFLKFHVASCTIEKDTYNLKGDVQFVDSKSESLFSGESDVVLKLANSVSQIKWKTMGILGVTDKNGEFSIKIKKQSSFSIILEKEGKYTMLFSFGKEL
ncbi:MAG: hypothetical protein HRT71_02510 [Flavobacteriales bacterium]|nr:hypothetical protein [Flavobacteriales bacterium]